MLILKKIYAFDWVERLYKGNISYTTPFGSDNCDMPIFNVYRFQIYPK